MGEPLGYMIDANVVGNVLLQIKEAIEKIERDTATRDIAVTLVKTAREDLMRLAKFVG